MAEYLRKVIGAFYSTLFFTRNLTPMSYQILIVDDDKDFREELAAYLHQYNVLQASSGSEALKLVKKPNLIDLVILDVVMAGFDGIEVLTEMKKIDSNLSIIMLTGNSTRDITVEALRARADDYFEKPVDLNGFHDAIKRILRHKNREQFADLHGINQKIAQSKQLIERNYDKMISLKDIACELCISPKYFSRVFKEHTGIGFQEYKLRVKIRHAEALLQKKEYTINQIADMFGYKNLESFIRLFKKAKGATPAMYRKRHKRMRAKHENKK